MKTVIYNCLLFLCLQLPFQTRGMADVRVLHLGSSYFYLVLMTSTSRGNVDRKASRQGGEGRGGLGRAEGRQAVLSRGIAWCCPPCSPCQAPIGLLESTMVIYGLVRGGPAHWHPLHLSRQLAEAYVAPRATRCAIFKMPGLHPKYSVLYFWCEMIFLGGGCRDFFFFIWNTWVWVQRQWEKQLGMTGREAHKKKAEGGGGHEGLIQRDSSVLIAAVKCWLPMVCSWIRNQKGLGLVYSWGLLRTLEGFAFVWNRLLGEFEIPKYLTRLKGMKRGAKCRAVNLLVALDPPLALDGLDLKGSRMPFVHQGLKKFLKKN